MPTLFLDAGALRHELSLQSRSDAPDGMGGSLATWTETAAMFGLIEPVGDQSGFGAGQTLESVTHRITIRARTGVASGMRFMRQGRAFDVLTVHNPDERGRYLICRCRETLA